MTGHWGCHQESWWGGRAKEFGMVTRIVFLFFLSVPVNLLVQIPLCLGWERVGHLFFLRGGFPRSEGGGGVPTKGLSFLLLFQLRCAPMGMPKEGAALGAKYSRYALPPTLLVLKLWGD